MTFVAITDRDTIDGALSLGPRPDVLVGEEISTPHPHDGRPLTVVALGLTRADHAAVARARGDAYSLARCLRSRGLVHFLATPVTASLARDHAAEEILSETAALFPLWQTRSAMSSSALNELAVKFAASAADGDADRDRWSFAGTSGGAGESDATRSRVPYANGSARESEAVLGVGGSGAWHLEDVARAYTCTPHAASAGEFLDHLRRGRAVACGSHDTPTRRAHRVYRRMRELLVAREVANGGALIGILIETLSRSLPDVSFRETIESVLAEQLGSRVLAAATLDLVLLGARDALDGMDLENVLQDLLAYTRDDHHGWLGDSRYAQSLRRDVLSGRGPVSLGGIRRAIGASLAYLSLQLPFLLAYHEVEKERSAAAVAERTRVRRDPHAWRRSVPSHGPLRHDTLNGGAEHTPNGNGTSFSPNHGVRSNGTSNGNGSVHAQNGNGRSNDAAPAQNGNGSGRTTHPHSPRRPRVAIAIDAADHTNGITITYRSLLDAFATTDLSVELLACLSEPNARAGVTHPLTSLAEIPAPYYGEYLLRVPAIADVLRFLTERHIDLVHIGTPGPMGFAATAAARVVGIPVLASYHTELPQYGYLLSGGALAEEDVWRAVRLYFGHCDRVLAPSRATLAQLAAHGLRDERLGLFPKGVDTARFSPRCRRQDFWAQRGLMCERVLLYVGRVSVEKGLDILFDAFESLRSYDPRLGLAVVGDGPYRVPLATRYGGANVLFTGFLDGCELAEAYASSDLFVFPSATDTFGLVVLEAFASGLPAVVCDRGGPPEIVRDGETGLVVPAGDSRAFAAATKRLLDASALAHSMGLAARRAAEATSWVSAAYRLEDIYCELAASRLTPTTGHVVRKGSTPLPEKAEGVQNLMYFTEFV
jgi:glycosyltransferase involved in cell wall biosynthesis